MKKKNIAVIGTGYWGKNLVRNFYNLDALHTVCDTREDIVRNFTEQYPGTAGVYAFADVIENEDVQGVVLATPAVSHAAMAKEALLAGKDVYVEKPLCLSEEEGAELIDLADQHGRILMVGHLLWYHAAVLRLKELVDTGALGRIQYIYSNRLNLGKLRREENVLWSFAPHDISVTLGLLGEMPESIQAQGGNYLHSRIADSTVSLLNFASGVRAHIFVSWLHPFKEQKLVVVGEKKMAVFDDTAPWPEKLALYPHSVEWSGNVPVAHKADVEYVALEESEPLRAECQAFLDAMSTRKAPYTDGREGLNVLKVLNRCQQALESGTAVPVEQQGAGVNRVNYQAHPSAVIDNDVIIGGKTKVWHFSHILSGSRIGPECSIGQNAVIGPNVQVGRGCKIQNNVSVYDGVTLEDYVFCGPSMVFTNVYNPRCEFPRKEEYRQTLVRQGATLGANCTIVCGISIGRYAFIGAGAVVKNNVPDFALMVGSPARQIGWMSRFGEQLDLPLTGTGEVTCPHTGERYRLEEGRVRILGS
ncbi:MAG: Gfo/Idh/MocA family oxidoreductase [Candidatus Electrothrix sp. YB6]